jgi:regulator of replication initiation timing
MKKNILVKLIKRLVTPTAEEIVWDQYVDFKSTISNLKAKLEIDYNHRKTLISENLDLDLKVKALERKLLVETNSSDMSYKTEYIEDSWHNKVKVYTVELVPNVRI